MTFTVTYRDKTGAKREEAIEAASRAECVATCRARGVSPIAIREGGRATSPRRPQSRADDTRNNADSDGSASRPYRTKWRFLAVLGTLAFLAILGGGAWWWLAARQESVPFPPPEKPSLKTMPKAPPTEAKPAAAKASSVPIAVVKASRTPAAGQPSVSTNAPSTNNVVYIVPPIDPDDPDMALRSRTSQELGSLLSITPGEPVPPFPYSFILEDDAKKQGETASNGNDIFLDSLRKAKIQMKDTDSEAVAKHKEAIVTAQLDLLDGIKEGLSVNDTIRAAYELRVRAYEYRTELISSLREWAGGNPTREEFDKALAEINDKLKENGIMTIPAGEVMPELEENDE